MPKFSVPAVARTVLPSLATAALLLIGLAGLRGCNPPQPPTPPTPPAAITLPPDTALAVGQAQILEPVTSATSIEWEVVPEGPTLAPFHGGTAAMFQSMQPGTFKVHARVADGGKVVCATCKLTVGGTPPGPGPTPTPDPTDPFFPTLKTAWGQESSADQAKRAILVSLYRQASTSTVQDPQYTTAGQLLPVLHTAAQNAVGDSLPHVRQAIANEWNTKMPTKPDAPLDAATRSLIAAQLTRMAALLEALK